MRILVHGAGRRVTRFIEGRLEEAAELFGTNLPRLPEGHTATGADPILVVELHSGLKVRAAAFIAATYESLAERRIPDPRPGTTPGAAGDHAQGAYLTLLTEITSNIIANERRLGLLNLFWLAHSKEVAEVVEEFFQRERPKGHIKYQMHPLLRGFYRNAHRMVWQRFRGAAPERLRYNLGDDFNQSLIESIFDDQLPLTEPSIAQLNLTAVLIDQNKRFRLTFPEYKEIWGICRGRLRAGLARRETRLLNLLAQRLPGLPSNQYGEDKAEQKILFNPHVLTYLFTDYEGTGETLRASRTLRQGAERRGGWGELVADYLDLVDAVRRTEVIDLLRQGITLIPPGLDDRQLKQLFAEGRLYRFHESLEVLNSARKVTILFADLRGFTRTSEGAVSEGELTQHLYAVFDPLAGIVKRFQGNIDKFTGDGVMITFGTTTVSKQDELNAVRTAVALQELMARFRNEGKTRFQMGISLHTGRAQVARFILDETAMDTTVIGRHVNIAGRLSGSGGKGPEEKDEGGEAPPPLQAGTEKPAEVWVDGTGVLYNVGIAASQDTVDTLAQAVPMERQEGQRGSTYSFRDPVLEKNILIEYVGDAKFKGVVRSIPVYRIVAV
ncbi:MAG: adenylate/guanylate cyclase domain-containing protein [Candidatus Methylomirabilales bacterium]